MIDLVRMPPEVSLGFGVSFDFGTIVARLPDTGGLEKTRTREVPMRRWNCTKGLFTKTRIEEFRGFIGARFGSFYGFRFWDPTDFSTNPSSQSSTTTNATDQFLGTGDGVRTRFSIRRSYNSVPSDFVQRLALEDRMVPIIGEVDDRLSKKLGLVAGTTLTTTVAVNATPVTFSFDYLTREFVLDAAPAVGQQVTWGGFYDWPAMFTEETDRVFEIISENWESQNVPQIGIELLPFDRFAPETDDPGGFGTLSWSSGSPLIQKAVRKNWYLDPGTSGLSVQVEDVSRHNPGGPHLVLINSGSQTVDVKDSLTGSTLFTISASGVVYLFCRDTGSSVAWFWVVAA